MTDDPFIWCLNTITNKKNDEGMTSPTVDDCIFFIYQLVI